MLQITAETFIKWKDRNFELAFQFEIVIDKLSLVNRMCVVYASKNSASGDYFINDLSDRVSSKGVGYGGAISVYNPSIYSEG